MIFEMPESIFDTLIFHISKHALFIRITFLVACLMAGILIFTYIQTRNTALLRTYHVNQLLRSMITVRKLIAEEHNRDELQRKVCEALAIHEGFACTWIFLTNPDRVTGTTSLHGECPHIQEYIQYTESGERSPCTHIALTTNDIQVYSRDRCIQEKCPLASRELVTQSVLVKRLAYENQIYGVLFAITPRHLLENKEEFTIFEDIAYDLAYALYTISRDEEIVTVAKDRDHREAIVETISYIASKFMPGTLFHENISDIFNRLGWLSNYNRIFLFENKIDEKGVLKAVSRWEWRKETNTLNETITSPLVLEYDQFIAWEMNLAAGDYIIGRGDDGDDTFKKSLSSQNIGSFVLVPVFIDTEWWGVIGCTDPDENRYWSHVDLMACTVTGALIGAAMVRDKMSLSVKKTEKRYYNLFNRISQAIILFEIQGKGVFSTLREVNDNCCETFSYNREDLYSLTISDLLTLPSDEMLHYQIGELHTTSNPTFEIDCVRHDSSTFPAEITLNLIQESDKTHILAVIQDISERKSAVMKIIASEQRYRQLFESAGEAILVLQNSVIYDCNNRAGLLFGKLPFELYESAFLDYAPEYQPDGQRSMEKLLHIILSVKKGNTEFFEWQIIGPNGAEIITDISMTRLSAEDDDIFLTLIHDISEKISEQKRMNFLSSITEQVSDFLLTIDADTTAISYANKAAEDEFGYTLAELEGKDIGILFNQLFDGEDNILEFISAIAKKRKYSCVIQGTHGDDSTFIADIRISPLFDEHNDIRALIIAGRNITGMIEMQERELISMKQIEENISQLAILNDHIRNPLTLIMGYTELENGLYAKKIIEQIHIIDTIIDKLDQGFLKSDSIREYLRKHHEIDKTCLETDKNHGDIVNSKNQKD